MSVQTTTSAVSASPVRTMTVEQESLQLPLRIRTTQDYVCSLLDEMESSGLFDGETLELWAEHFFGGAFPQKDGLAMLITRIIQPRGDEKFEEKSREILKRLTPADQVDALITKHELAIIQQNTAPEKKAILQAKAEASFAQNNVDAQMRDLNSRFDAEKKNIDDVGDSMVARSEERGVQISALENRIAAERNRLLAQERRLHALGDQLEQGKREQQALLGKGAEAVRGV